MFQLFLLGQLEYLLSELSDLVCAMQDHFASLATAEIQVEEALGLACLEHALMFGSIIAL
jgi:hypothetical protein